MKSKSEVLDKFKSFQFYAERFLNRMAVNVRTDKGTEFCNKQLEKYLEEQGIHAERTNPYTPQQNSVVKRFNGTVLNSIKTMLKSRNLKTVFGPKHYYVLSMSRIGHVTEAAEKHHLKCITAENF